MASEQYITSTTRESPEIEARKLALIQEAQRLYNSRMEMPAIEAAGLSLGDQQAMDLARQGIGSFEPYLQAGSQGITQGMDLTQRGALAAGSVQTAPQFQTAQDVLGSGINSLSSLPQYEKLAGAGLQDIATGIGRTAQAGDLLNNYMVADLAPAASNINAAQLAAASGAPSDFANSQRIMAGGMQGAQGATLTAQQAAQMTTPQFQTAQNFLGKGVGALAGAAQGYDPQLVQAYMNPYQQQVTQEALSEIRRQANIARQGQAAQAVSAGAFGGTREGVQRAEFERGVQDVMSKRIMEDYAQNYAQAQQASMQGFEAQQQRQLNQGQGLQQAAGVGGQLAGQQAQVAFQSAVQQFQQAGYDANTAMQLAQLQQANADQGLRQSATFQGIGSLQGQQAMQQTQLGQSGAALRSQIGGQQAQLGLLPGQIASNQSAIATQRANALNQFGQGIGSLAAQQAQIDLSKGQTLGQLGYQMGTLGAQQGSIGEAMQKLGAADVNILGGIGQLERANDQQQLDAIRATKTQEAADPYQRLAFVSDIMKGSPSTQMSMTSQTAPSASPLQTIAGLGIAGIATANAARSGLFPS